MNKHTTVLRSVFLCATAFLLLAGVVFRLFNGASPLAELLGLAACAVPAILALSTYKHWGKRLADSITRSPVIWLAVSVVVGVAAVYLSCLAEQHSTTHIIPLWGGVILASAAVFAALAVRKYLPGLEYIFFLWVGAALCLAASKFHALSSAVVIGTIFLAVMVLALIRRFFRPASFYSYLPLVLTIGGAGCYFLYSPLSWELYEWWDALTRAPFNDESVESWWTIVARDAVSQSCLFGSIPDHLPMSEQIFKDTPLLEAVTVQADNGYQLLHMLVRWGWLGLLPVLIAMAAFLICGYRLTLRRRGAHAYVSLAAMTAMAVPMLLSLSQNLGYNVVLVDKMPLLDFGPIDNALWLLLILLVVSERSLRTNCCELLPRDQRKDHLQRYKEEFFDTLTVTHFSSGEALLRSHAGLQLLRTSLQEHICPDRAYTEIQLSGNFNGIRKALEPLELCANGTDVLMILESWSSSVPQQDIDDLCALVELALPVCSKIRIVQFPNQAHPAGHWLVRIILTHSESPDTADRAE